MLLNSKLLLNLRYTKLFKLSVYGALTDSQGISGFFTVTMILIKQLVYMLRFKVF